MLYKAKNVATTVMTARRTRGEVRWPAPFADGVAVGVVEVWAVEVVAAEAPLWELAPALEAEFTELRAAVMSWGIIIGLVPIALRLMVPSAPRTSGLEARNVRVYLHGQRLAQ